LAVNVKGKMEVSVLNPRREGTLYCRGDLLRNLRIKWKYYKQAL
jgi:hypothetical protein